MSDETVVLLHSGGMSSRQWRALAGALKDWRVVAPDLLGSGANPLWPEGEPFELAQDVDALLGLLGDAAPLHLVGHSYGAVLAMKLAARDPARVRSLAMYEPPAFGVLHATQDRLGLDAIALVEADPIFTDVTVGGKAPWMRLFIEFWNGPNAWEALPQATRDAFLRVGWKVFQEVMGLMNDRTNLADYQKLTMPSLLMVGGRSPLAERRVMEMLAQVLPNASLKVFEKAGHMGPITQMTDVNLAIQAHLSAARG